MLFKGPKWAIRPNKSLNRILMPFKRPKWAIRPDKSLNLKMLSRAL